MDIKSFLSVNVFCHKNHHLQVIYRSSPLVTLVCSRHAATHNSKVMEIVTQQIKEYLLKESFNNLQNRVIRFLYKRVMRGLIPLVLIG